MKASLNEIIARTNSGYWIDVLSTVDEYCVKHGNRAIYQTRDRASAVELYKALADGVPMPGLEYFCPNSPGHIKYYTCLEYQASPFNGVLLK